MRKKNLRTTRKEKHLNTMREKKNLKTTLTGTWLSLRRLWLPKTQVKVTKFLRILLIIGRKAY